jgi:hypothetical protein
MIVATVGYRSTYKKPPRALQIETGLSLPERELPQIGSSDYSGTKESFQRFIEQMRSIHVDDKIPSKQMNSRCARPNIGRPDCGCIVGPFAVVGEKSRWKLPGWKLPGSWLV